MCFYDKIMTIQKIEWNFLNLTEDIYKKNQQLNLTSL